MPNLLRSGNPILTPAEIEAACERLNERVEDGYDLDFIDSVRHYNREAYKHPGLSGRPLPAAADEVAETAATAREMLEELKAGWLWQLLTIKAKEPS